jgi:hypothetical protein
MDFSSSLSVLWYAKIAVETIFPTPPMFACAINIRVRPSCLDPKFDKYCINQSEDLVKKGLRRATTEIQVLSTATILLVIISVPSCPLSCKESERLLTSVTVKKT